MSTTITNQPPNQPSSPSSQATNQTSAPRPVHRRRRVLLSVIAAAALGFGVGAAVVAVTDSGGAAGRHAHAAPTASPTVDVQALWRDLSSLPASDEANVVVGLTPSVRAQLQAVAEGYAVEAEHH